MFSLENSVATASSRGLRMSAHFLEATLTQQESQGIKDVLGQNTRTRREGVVSYLLWEGQRLGEEGQNSHRGVGVLNSLSVVSSAFPKAYISQDLSGNPTMQGWARPSKTLYLQPHLHQQKIMHFFPWCSGYYRAWLIQERRSQES